MKVYLVGGAVRDKLLGRSVVEKDYVVVGATPDDLISQGYKPVGKDFPVFLHPETNEEYALARTERKTGKGHTDFDCFADPSVTLEEDLLRRDLTINAIAQDASGKLIDPYHGQNDLLNRLLKHVSPAFSEDPLRVYRVARFMAQLGNFNFTIADETLNLMKQVVASGECDALSGERVWREVFKALESDHTERFFEVLENIGVNWFRSRIKSGMTTIKSGMTTAKSGMTNDSSFCHSREGGNPGSLVKYALYFHDIPPPFTPPKKYSELAKVFKAHKQCYQNIQNLDAKSIEIFFSQCDIKRRPERFALFLKACEIFFESSEQKVLIEKLAAAYLLPPPKELLEEYSGLELKEALRGFRVNQLEDQLQ